MSLRKVLLQQLPEDSFSFACLELRELMQTQMEQSAVYFKKFSWTNNKKQHAFKIFLKNPITKNIQHFGLRGSIGSGKSIAAIAYFVEQMLTYPGVRILGMRRTHGQLIASLYEQIKGFNFEYCIPATYKESKSSGPPQITYKNGSKWVFWSSESVVESTTTDTARGLGSQEYSGALLEEADMIHPEAINTVSQRLRQKSGVPVRLIAYVYNPPPTSHWVYKKFVTKVSVADEAKDDYHELQFTMEDNRQNLPEGFIESMYREYRNKPSVFKRMILGEHGPEVRGTPIYGEYFDRSIHIAKSSFIENWERRQLWKDGPLCLGFDFGFRHPALLVMQDVKIDTFQQIRILCGWLGDNVTLKPFAKYYLDEITRMFPMAEIECYGDPAGNQKDGRGVTSETAFDVLRSLGLNPKSKASDEGGGIDLIIELLTTLDKHKMLGLQPALIVDPSAAEVIDMLEAGFTQDDNSRGGKLKPYDDDHYIHLADGLRYDIVHRRSLRKVRSTMGRQDANRPEYATIDYETGERPYQTESLSYHELSGMLGEMPNQSATYNFGRT